MEATSFEIKRFPHVSNSFLSCTGRINIKRKESLGSELRRRKTKRQETRVLKGKTKVTWLPVQSDRKFSAVLGTIFPKRPMRMRPVHERRCKLYYKLYLHKLQKISEVAN
jgi:hypothetical protein